jgi:hypothetical protein
MYKNVCVSICLDSAVIHNHFGISFGQGLTWYFLFKETGSLFLCGTQPKFILMEPRAIDLQGPLYCVVVFCVFQCWHQTQGLTHARQALSASSCLDWLTLSHSNYSCCCHREHDSGPCYRHLFSWRRLVMEPTLQDCEAKAWHTVLHTAKEMYVCWKNA